MIKAEIPRCETCFYWNRMSEDMGSCSLLGNSDSIFVESNTSDYTTEYSFETHQEFSCIHNSELK